MSRSRSLRRARALPASVVATAVAAAALATLSATLSAPPAQAHADPNIAVRLADIRPALPTGADVRVLDAAAAYLSLANTGSIPAVALDQDGAPFLQVSSAGVFARPNSPVLPLTGRQIAEASPAPPGCCPDGTWLRLTSQSLWSWPDPRLDPPELRDPQVAQQRGLASLQSEEPLARWSLRIRMGEQTHTIDGVLENRVLGEVRTEVESVPAGLTATAINARPPQLRLLRPPGTTVVILGADGKPFLRITDAAVMARSDSPEYRIHRRAIGLYINSATAWVPLGAAAADTTRIVWADQRLAGALPPDAAGAERLALTSWSIPLLVDGRRDAIRGTTYFEPERQLPGAADAGSSSMWSSRTNYLLAGGLTVLLAAAYRLSRRSRPSAPSSRS